MTRTDIPAELDAREADQARLDRMYWQQYHRRRNLPGQLEAARLKVIHLEREAERLGLSIPQTPPMPPQRQARRP